MFDLQGGKSMKLRKLLSIMLVGAMMLSMTVTAHAQEIETEEEIIWEETAPTPTSSEGSVAARASWGYGTITSSDPLFSHPKACANTYTYAGNAYRLYAQINLIDADSFSILGPEITGYNISSVSTAYIESPTEKCDFTGVHEVQDTESSVTQYAYTHKRYS